MSLAPLIPNRRQRRTVLSPGVAVGRPVPPFHRVNAEPVADGSPGNLKGRSEGCVGADDKSIIARYVEAEGMETLAEGGDTFDRADGNVFAIGHPEPCAAAAEAAAA